MLVNINKDLIKCLKLESHQLPMNLRTVKTESHSHVIFWKLLMKLLGAFTWRIQTENLVLLALVGGFHME